MPSPATLGVFDLDDPNPLTDWHEDRGLDPDPKILIEDLCIVQALGTFERGLQDTDICLRQVSVMVQKLELHQYNPDFSGNLSVDKEMLINYVVKGH